MIYVIPWSYSSVEKMEKNKSKLKPTLWNHTKRSMTIQKSFVCDIHGRHVTQVWWSNFQESPKSSYRLCQVKASPI